MSIYRNPNSGSLNFLVPGSLEKSSSIDWVQLLNDWSASGYRLVRSGQDLLLVDASGLVHRVEGFFDLTVDLAQVYSDAGQLWLWESTLSKIEGVGFTPMRFAQASSSDAVVADSPAEASEKPIAKISEVAGLVQVVRNGEVLQLKAGDEIFLGDAITTQAGAQAKLQFLNAAGEETAESGATITEDSNVKVLGRFENTEAGKIALTEISLKVEVGTVNVQKDQTTDIEVQVETPSGRVEVPQVGLAVTVGQDKQQTTLSALGKTGEDGTGNANAETVVRLVSADGTAQEITVSNVSQQLPSPVGLVGVDAGASADGQQPSSLPENQPPPNAAADAQNPSLASDTSPSGPVAEVQQGLSVNEAQPATLGTTEGQAQLTEDSTALPKVTSLSQGLSTSQQVGADILRMPGQVAQG